MPFIIIAILVVAFLCLVCVVPKNFVYVIETRGSFVKLLKSGLNFRIPFIEKVACKVPLNEQVCKISTQPAITKDCITVFVSALLRYKISDPVTYVYKSGNSMVSFVDFILPVLRSVVAELHFEEALGANVLVADGIQQFMREEVDKLGLQVTGVDVQSICPSEEMRAALAQ